MPIGQDYLSILMAQIAQQGGQLAQQPTMPNVSGGGTPQQGGMRQPRGGTPQQGGMRRPSGHRMQQVRPMGGGNMPMPPQMGGEFESLDARMAMAKAASMSPSSFQGGGARARAPQEAMRLEQQYRQKQEALIETERQKIVMQVVQAGHAMGMSQDDIDKVAALAYDNPEMGAEWVGKANTHQQLKGAVIKMTGDEELAQYVADLSRTDPDSAKVMFDDISKQALDPSKADTTTINMPPPAGYRFTNPERTELEPIVGGKPWRDVKEAEEKNIGRLIDQNQTSQLITQQVSAIRKEIDESWLPATGLGGATTRWISQMVGKPKGEGEIGLFESFFAAGEVARRNEVIKNNIGLAAINNMRQFSASGGALGNVSNFEVRMVQNVKDALDPTRGEEDYLTALDTIEIIQKRSAYFARHGQDMAEKAKESGLRPEIFIMDVLNKQFPIDARFTQDILDEETGWDGLTAPDWAGQEDNTPPAAVDPNEQITIPTDQPEGAWAIKKVD